MLMKIIKLHFSILSPRTQASKTFQELAYISVSLAINQHIPHLVEKGARLGERLVL